MTVSAWPDWATRLVASGMAVEHRAPVVEKVRNRILDRFPHGDLADEFIATRKLHVACTRCHHGWMSRIDAMARPMALPLIKGAPAILAPKIQSALAAWITKTVMIAELASIDGPVTPQSDRTQMQKTSHPPKSWRIWAAHHAAPKCEARYVRHTASLGTASPMARKRPAANNTQSVTFGIGRILFHVMTSTVPGMKFELPFDAANTFRMLWPAGNTLAWPPQQSLRDHEMEAFTSAFDRDFGAPEVELVRAMG